ncbi:hypothetical protein [Actinomadura rudentiformis]|uniref:Uncharacterized protein n=1 Tax=Actinomadura rudentiformis TaxID=359158 RepID=A0A6H9YE47_9ACTN|nr:hypothetical protein [Actinomadura rudentiformis]KAB2341881.1 hypothetical protein F8566_40605 [Actinomadura rudentiformis]
MPPKESAPGQANNTTASVTERDAYLIRAMFDHGVEVGYARAEADMAAAWKVVAEKVRGIPRQMEVQERRLVHDTLWAYCTAPECNTQVEVHRRVDFRLVLCPKHLPKSWCSRHRVADTCASEQRLKERLDASQRPEYTGGPVEWNVDRPPLDRGTAA